MNEYQRAAASWDAEVEREAARLIETGMAPWQASRYAAEIVREKRRRRNIAIRDFRSTRRDEGN